MNERIKEIYGVATDYTMSCDDGTINQVKLNHICAEKFAELIILECALMCLEDKDSQRIVKHFGVEE
jgi:hypothetical protein